MLVYYFVPFIVSYRYLLFRVSNGHNSVTVQNRTHVYMNFFHHKDLGNHLLQLRPKVVKHPVFSRVFVILQKTPFLMFTSLQPSCLTFGLFLSPRIFLHRSQWPPGLRRRSAVARLLRLWVQIPPGAWMCVCCECCVLSGKGLCDELITRPEESFRMWCVVMSDLETL